jgi:hypothetical protein
MCWCPGKKRTTSAESADRALRCLPCSAYLRAVSDAGLACRIAIDRRTFLYALGVGILTAPLAVEAQQAGTGKVYRIGFLRAGQPPETYVEGFQQGLRERGYVDGQNVVVEFRTTDGSFDQLPQFGEELVQNKRTTGGPRHGLQDVQALEERSPQLVSK